MSAAGPIATSDVGADPADRSSAVYLVRGSDPSLVAQAVHALTERLVAGGDPSLMVEEFGGPGVEPFDVGAVIDACTTPPFLVDRRVVVVRDIGQLTPGDAKRLVEYLGDPLPTTALVLVAGGGTLPQTLSKSVGSSGEVVDTSVGTGRARTQWLADHLKGGPVRLDGPATALLSDHLGEDMGRLEGLLDTLASAYGDGATVSVDDLEPFLGTAGALAPWDLTDAIDAGKTAKALGVLRRMLDGPDSHPLRVMSVLHNHYRKMLQLDGSGCDLSGGGGPGARDEERLPGQEGPGRITSTGDRPDRPGRPAPGPGRSGPAGCDGSLGGDGTGGPGGPTQPTVRLRALAGRASDQATASRDCSPASATFSVQWNPSQ